MLIVYFLNTNFGIINGIGAEDVEQGLLLETITFPEHQVITIGSVDI